jgi:hypothetical protein
MKREPFKIKTKCWNCGRENNRQLEAIDEDGPPKNGDVSFCFQCGNFAIFDYSFEDNVRKPTPAENFELKHDQFFQKLYTGWYLWSQKYRKDTDT